MIDIVFEINVLRFPTGKYHMFTDTQSYDLYCDTVQSNARVR